MEKIIFQSAGFTIVGNFFLPQTKNPPGILILHGAGHSHKEKFLEIQKSVYEKGHASLAIDFTGVGESSGEFTEGSLEVRLQNAADALKELKKYADPENISVLGSSMGGFVGAVLGSENHVKNILLLAPAAYSQDAENKKLNNTFTKEITKSQSWENSRSFPALKKFNGRVLVLYGENDTKIPQGVQKRYQEIASKKGEWHNIVHMGHNLIAAENSQKNEAIHQVISFICDFLTRHRQKAT
ncbi:MAG TPA: alpha/beta fold hydrolase [Patescibacteria group bacterium]|nr:alpha/beta fold hydrolase [Patescibacteria group bacterium]